MDKRDKVREQIATIWGRHCEGDHTLWINEILAIPGLAVVERDAKLPEIPLFLYDKYEDRGLLRRGAINYSRMLAGWLKEAK